LIPEPTLEKEICLDEYDKEKYLDEKEDKKGREVGLQPRMF